MRILLNLESLKDCEYDLKYFHKLQGFIYNLIKENEYKILHNKIGYKFFCFSNIYPFKNINIGDKRKLMISSPDKFLIKYLKERLEKLTEENIPINIGEMSFKLSSISILNTKIKNNSRLISTTPIIIRIPEKNYDKYGIPTNYRKKRYVYWRPQYSFEAFIKQLENNLFKKYNEFYKTRIEEFPIFEEMKYKRLVVSHILINGKEYKLVGSIWEFIFTYLNNRQRKILEFGMDCGFGERNSFGFGFVNKKNEVN
ncbi:MAG: CRISPR-associated endoribonuclease Cas6 [Candidatus Aenigmarchaeota archaeon]|nr:CRISPR-associated endoribonuclease Cas6 [Candidatus Aenigmarchaeota archaeon]